MWVNVRELNVVSKCVCIYFVDAERIFVYIFRWYLGGAIHENIHAFFLTYYAYMDINAWWNTILLRHTVYRIQPTLLYYYYITPL